MELAQLLGRVRMNRFYNILDEVTRLADEYTKEVPPEKVEEIRKAFLAGSTMTLEPMSQLMYDWFSEDLMSDSSSSEDCDK